MKRFVRAIITATIFLMVSVASSVAQIDAEDDDSIPYYWVWYPTAQCSEPLDGPGATPETAIKLEDFYDIYYDILEGKGNDDQKYDGSNFNCRFVEISGYFRWTNYYDYRGYLYASPSEFYLENESRFIVQNFADKATRRSNLNGAVVNITGRFYDLCHQADKDEESSGQSWFIIGGPCHYGDMEGMMLRDVIVDSVSQGPNLRLKGEMNRALIGDLEEMDKTWPEYKSAKATFFDWIASVKTGREQYWKTAINNSNYKDEAEKAEKLEEALSDDDDWITFLATSDESPIVSRSLARLKRLEFKIYENLDYREGWNESGNYRNVTACICLQRTCENEWPLFDVDAGNFADQYLCRELTRGRDEVNWQW